MKVSIIIPVYNAADFVREAVESVLCQPETAEIILVEDGSTDNSLDVCQTLAAEFSPVRLYRHPDNGNHGSAAARNLGIRQAAYPYVAFLDADDFFVPGRFATARKLFKEQPDIDGVYEAIGTHFQNEAARQSWFAAGHDSGLTTMNQTVPPERLFETMMKGDQGHFSGDGLVVKRTIFEKSGLFDERLIYYQDTDLWTKMAATARLVPGHLDRAVAMRRIHGHNRFPARQSLVIRQKYGVMMWRNLWRWSLQRLEPARQELLFGKFLKESLKFYHSKPAGVRQLKTSTYLVTLPFRYPSLLTTPYFWKLYTTYAAGYTKGSHLVSYLSRLRRPGTAERS